MNITFLSEPGGFKYDTVVVTWPVGIADRKIFLQPVSGKVQQKAHRHIEMEWISIHV